MGLFFTILSLYLIALVCGYWLEYLNISHLKRCGSQVPEEFEGKISHEVLDRINNYTIVKSEFGFVASITHNIIIILFYFGGILNSYNSWILSFNLPFITSGLLYFLILIFIEIVLKTPFNIYRIFRIEKRFGFSTTTFGLWIADFAKSILLTAIVSVFVISSGLYIIQRSPYYWWFWFWCFSFAFSIFVLYISPYIIEPLFNRFTPIDKIALEERISALMDKVGIKVSRVFKMDASKRTRHTNAYFTGIGKVKRIVLFDTLLEKLDDNEILAVLAHEIGHWKKWHLLKRILVTESITLIALYAAFKLFEGNILISVFDIGRESLFAKIMLFLLIVSIAVFPVTPLFNYLSRRDENEADLFASRLTGSVAHMVSALLKLSRDNLSNLHPHPLYAAFYYSHPPVLERIRYLKGIG